MDQVHNEIFGRHMNGYMLAQKIILLGYYCTTIEKDYYLNAKTCPKCQLCMNLQHVMPSLLYTFTSLWPFSIWGIDIIGKIIPLGTWGGGMNSSL